MEKIIKKADIYLEIENDKVCCTVELSDSGNPLKDLDSIMKKLDRILFLHSVNKIKLESIYFREEKINAEN